MNNELYISMYHYTRDLKNSKYPEIKGLDYSLFEEQLLFFKNNFNVVRMEDVIDSFYNNKALPEKAILLTFDDGYIDNYCVALPLLKKYGFQGSFFIPAKTFVDNKLLDVNKIHFILASSINKRDVLLDDLFNKLDEYRLNDNYKNNLDLYKEFAIPNRFDDKDTIFIKRILQTAIPEEIRNIIADELFIKYVGTTEEEFARELYMSKEQIQALKDNGMYIGLHGYDHYWLGNLSLEEMKKDIDNALYSMREFINTNNWVMNYPYGSYNKDVIDYITKKGCKLGLSTNVGIVNTEDCNIYALPRLDCNDFPPKSDNYKKYGIR